MRKSVTRVRAQMLDKTSKQYSLGHYDPFPQLVCHLEKSRILPKICHDFVIY